MKISVELRIGADGALALSLPRYSATAARIINALPRVAWDASAKVWRAPLVDLPLVREKLFGCKLVEDAKLRGTRPAPSSVKGEGNEPKEVVETLRAQAARPIEVLDYDFKTKPFAHQIRGFALARASNSFALLCEMGTGKTKMGVDVVSYRMQRGHIDGALIVCPLAVVYNWQREFDAHSPLPAARRRCVVIAGSQEERDAALAEFARGAPLAVINYEGLLRYSDALVQILKRRKFAMLCDESTRIKNPKTKQSKAAKKLGAHCVARYIATGSPITNNPLDAFGQFNFLDWRILGHANFYSFRAEYGEMASTNIGNGRVIKQVVGYKNLDRLASRIAAHSYRVLKRDCLDLPEKLYRVIDVAMTPKQKQVYREMKEDAVTTLEGSKVVAPLVITKLLRLSQIAAGFLPKLDENGIENGIVELEDSPKTDACVELVEEAIENGKKVIVWGRFLPEIARLARRLERFGVVTYQGDVSGADRQKRVDAFQRDASTRVFIGQIQTGGMAITLTAASLVIYHSNSYGLADRLQSEDRAHRIGQKNPVDYVDLACKGTIDRLILRALREKKDLADIITGDNARALLDTKEL